jgi:hypothetical protein
VAADVDAPMRRWATIALFALCTTMSCGELARPQPTSSVITFTLTPTGCTAEGVGALLSAQFDALVVNKTSSVAAFNFLRLRDGHAFTELELHIQKRQVRIAANDDTPDLQFPGMTTEQASRFVNAGQTEKFEVALVTGSYGLVCRQDAPVLGSKSSLAIFLLGPFRVV